MKQKQAHISFDLSARLIGLFIFLALPLFSQTTGKTGKGKNLVPNSSFETHKGRSNTITNATPWRNVGTVDYYMKADKKDTSKFRGARTGTCYAGLRFQPDYKEYMYVPLLEPLQKGCTYRFRMYVRLLGQSTVSVKQLGVYFSEDIFKVGMVFDSDEIVDSTYKKGISGSMNWIPIKGDYVARGGEKYIIVGNFRTRMKDDFVKKNKWDLFEFREAYYFVDDVTLRKIASPNDSLNKLKFHVDPILPDNVEPNTAYIIKQLKFEPGTAQFKHDSYRVLDELVSNLNDYPLGDFEINAYSDNQGNEAVSRKLTKDRAKAVYDYLREQGIVNPMVYHGYGPVSPIAPNDTPENREKNQRVEIVITKIQ